MENNEMNNFAEGTTEMVENAVPENAETTPETTMVSFDFTPSGWLKVVAASALGTAIAGGTVFVVKKGINFVIKEVNAFRENRATKRKSNLK